MPTGLIDTHAHILPGLDDGPPDLETSLELLRAAWDAGTRRIVTTPHLFHDGFPEVSAEKAQKGFRQLTADLERHSETPGWEFLADLELHLGAEHYLSPQLRIALRDGSVMPLNGSRYLLVEGPLTLSALNWKESLNRIMSAGYFPVIAHPERYWPFQREPAQLQQFLELGCLVQVNAASLEGTAQRSTVRTARKLLRRGWIHLIASDGHHPRYRPAQLDRIAAWLPGGLDGEATRRLLMTNPAAVADDADPPEPLPVASGFWSRLRR